LALEVELARSVRGPVTVQADGVTYERWITG
jgi:hypothetical protein